MTDFPDAAWAAAAPYFRQALRRAGDVWTLPEIRQEIEAGRAQFWHVEDAYAVTKFVYFPRVKALNFWLLGGDLDALKTLRPLVERWGVEHDCLIFMGDGRAGFGRVGRSDGYVAVSTLFAKDLRKGLQ